MRNKLTALERTDVANYTGELYAVSKASTLPLSRAAGQVRGEARARLLEWAGAQAEETDRLLTLWDKLIEWQ